MNTPDLRYRGYRFPREIIAHCVWLYFRFSMSFRDVELLMAERGVTVTYETIRAWCERFGRDYAKRIRGRRVAIRAAFRQHISQVKRANHLVTTT